MSGHGGAVPGALVGIAYDADADVVVEPGHALVTPTGRIYVIVTARRQEKGKYAGRWHLRCLVAEQVPPGATRHVLRWYSRGPHGRSYS